MFDHSILFYKKIKVVNIRHKFQIKIKKNQHIFIFSALICFQILKNISYAILFHTFINDFLFKF